MLASQSSIYDESQQTLGGKSFGHRRHRTTAGYAHLADERLVQAAERVGRIIALAIETV